LNPKLNHADDGNGKPKVCMMAEQTKPHSWIALPCTLQFFQHIWVSDQLRTLFQSYAESGTVQLDFVFLAES
jgi:hypothetical protein